MSEDRVTVTVEDHIARVSLSRPDKRNALDFGMFKGLVEAADSLSGDREYFVYWSSREVDCSGWNSHHDV